MSAAVLLLGFGEPAEATLDSVTPFLEAIFVANAALDPSSNADLVRRRARAMAEQRAPELAADLRRIGGSPLNAQAAAQAEGLRAELAARGHDVLVATGMQFTEPSIPAAVQRALGRGVERLITLPTYPLSGPSTTLAALESARKAVSAAGADVPVHEIAGWHAHPTYTALRVDGVRVACERAGLDLADPRTRLVFCAHGTPLRYLADGSRYDLYVEDHCQRVAAALDVDDYVLGYQNHENRPGLAWTGPEITAALGAVDAERVVVVPVSFMQEHSETLAELDLGLRAAAEARGLAFHRVPVPHDDPRFVRLLADLVVPWLEPAGTGATAFEACRCRAGALCLNGSIGTANA